VRLWYRGAIPVGSDAAAGDVYRCCLRAGSGGVLVGLRQGMAGVG